MSTSLILINPEIKDKNKIILNISNLPFDQHNLKDNKQFKNILGKLICMMFQTKISQCCQYKLKLDNKH